MAFVHNHDSVYRTNRYDEPGTFRINPKSMRIDCNIPGLVQLVDTFRKVIGSFLEPAKRNFNECCFYRVESVGIFIIMFQRILKTILKVTLIFSVLFIAFALAFFVLMQNDVCTFGVTYFIAALTIFSDRSKVDFIARSCRSSTS